MDADDETDIYKKTFKLYKNWDKSLPLIDLTKEDWIKDGTFELIEQKISQSSPNCSTITHFKPFDQWKAYKLVKGINGFIVIPEILREEYRRDWFKYFQEMPNDHSNLNLKANVPFDYPKDKLRWVTFGYHYNWDKKIYDLKQSKIIIPDRIKDLASMVSNFFGQESSNFRPEAGIVNYYTPASTLFFHTDHSELNHQAPLFSLSLGISAIFLIGGLNRESSHPIIPIVLRDSDLVIMSKNSRLALHAVPKILYDCNNENKGKIKHKIVRINVNIRQVF